MTEVNGHKKDVLPKGWQWMEVKNIVESIQYGYTESSSKEIVGPKFLRITDIQNNKVQWDDVPYCSIEESNKKKYLLKDGDLLFARTGATVGKSFLIKGNIPESIFASYLIRVRFKQSILDKYVYNYFQSLHYWQQITEGQVGIGQPNVNGTKLGQLVVPVAPTGEQQQIVSKIEELFSELDKSIEQLKIIQRQLKVYRQSVLKWAFEGKLIHSNSLEQKSLGNYIEKIDAGKSFRCDEREPRQEEIGVLKVSAVTWGEFDESESKTVIDKSKVNENYFVNKGDFLLSRANTIELVGTAVIVKNVSKKVMLSDKTLRIRFDKTLDQFYVLYYLRSRRGRKQIEQLSTGNQESMRNIGQERIKQIEIPYCSIEEQKSIVEEIESRLSVADKLKETITNSLQQAEALRQSILKKAFEGKLI
jgi:type I restriction enzyme, S subunit